MVFQQVEGDLLLLDPACGHELRYPRVPQPVDMARQLGRNGGRNDDLVDDFEVAAGGGLGRPGLNYGQTMGNMWGKYGGHWKMMMRRSDNEDNHEGSQ